MKFNTKQCKAMSNAPESFMIVNKFIPDSRFTDDVIVDSFSEPVRVVSSKMPTTTNKVKQEASPTTKPVKAINAKVKNEFTSPSTNSVNTKVKEESVSASKNKSMMTPVGSSGHGSKAKKEEQSQLSGRKVKYETAIVYTPVMLSDRNKGENQRAIERDDLDVLQSKLEDMFISSSTTKFKTPVKKESKKEEVKEKREEPALASDTPSPMMGHSIKNVLSYRTCITSPVRRSARIAAREEERE